jgi:DNA modification methylase
MKKQDANFLIEIVSIDSVIPYARNPRKHAAGIDKVAASICEFGFRQPIVVDGQNVIVVGHARYEAARRIGLPEVPIHRATTLTDSQIKAYRIADNRTQQESAWDDALLSLEMQELEHECYDLSHTAFDVSEIDALLKQDGFEDDALLDEVPIPSHNPITKTGDIWQLGNHRLVCGDSRCEESYRLLLGAGKADMIYTDPPYNVNYQGKAGTIANDAMSASAFLSFLQDVFLQLHAHVKAGGGVYISYSEKETESFYRALREAGFKQSSCLIWVKNNLVLGRGDYHCQHEPIWYGWKEGVKHIWHGGRNKTTIAEAGNIVPLSYIDENSYVLQWSDLNIIIRGENLSIEAVESGVIHHDKPQSSDLHPTMKPVGLVERFIKNSSARGDIVLDVFGGSGSTLIACERLNRCARLIEIDPPYCDVIVERWQDITGEKAKNAVTGQHFSNKGEKHGTQARPH